MGARGARGKTEAEAAAAATTGPPEALLFISSPGSPESAGGKNHTPARAGGKS